ncbi:unnamed protein product [Lasius platythorax]|uniref:Uncharacterized protein n=1 Tax=Lasius platythorax TaxID=488582 RepID=A0AAV2P297_9HYME
MPIRISCGMPYQSPAPIIFELARKLHIPPTLCPSPRRARTPGISSLVGEPYGRVRDYQQPPWQQTLPKGRRSSRLGLPSRLQVIAADCNPGKPHPALPALADEKFDASREWARCKVHARSRRVFRGRMRKSGGIPRQPSEQV